jgi:hypothetical protein
VAFGGRGGGTNLNSRNLSSGCQISLICAACLHTFDWRVTTFLLFPRLPYSCILLYCLALYYQLTVPRDISLFSACHAFTVPGSIGLQSMQIISYEGIVQRKLRWVMSVFNRQLLLYCLGTYMYIFFYLKGNHNLKWLNWFHYLTITKISFVGSM